MHEFIVMIRGKKGEPIVNIEQEIVRHSPDGFEWGYYGSGPSDLALNILALYTDRATAEKYHQPFKTDFIGPMPKKGGKISKDQIVNWLRNNIEIDRSEDILIKVQNIGIRDKWKDFLDELDQLNMIIICQASEIWPPHNYSMTTNNIDIYCSEKEFKNILLPKLKKMYPDELDLHGYVTIYKPHQKLEYLL